MHVKTTDLGNLPHKLVNHRKRNYPQRRSRTVATFCTAEDSAKKAMSLLRDIQTLQAILYMKQLELR